MANSNPTTPVTPLSEEEKAYLKEREDIVVEGLQTKLKTSLEAAKALYEIDHYVCASGRKLWQHSSPTFPAYCKAKWGYERSQVFRQRTTGAFLSSPGLTVLPANARQVQELLTEEKVPTELRIECWNWMVTEAQKAHAGPDQSPAILTLKGKDCDTLVWRFLEVKGLADSARRATKKATHERGKITKALKVLKEFAAAPGQEDAIALPSLLSKLEDKYSDDPERWTMNAAEVTQARSALLELKENGFDEELCAAVKASVETLGARVWKGKCSHDAAAAFESLQSACKPVIRRADLASVIKAIDVVIQNQLNG